MKRFHFRLERILDIRSYRERQWLAKLASASGICTRLNRKIADNGEASRGAYALDAKRGEALDLSLLAYRENYINRLGAEHKRLRRQLEQELQKRAEVQRKYQEVSRDKKVLEKLKEKRESDYYARAKLEEFKDADDLNSSRFIRKRL